MRGLPLALSRYSFFRTARGKAGVLGSKGLKVELDGGRADDEGIFDGDVGRVNVADFEGLIGA